MRLNRLLARAGISSRRKVEDFIKAGLVKVNERVVTKLSTEVDPDKDVVLFRDEAVTLPVFKYLALNKPLGFAVTKEDPHAKKTVFELLPPDPTLMAVGRLDVETSGLLLFTNDGDFAQNIIHPSRKIEKEYQVIAKAEITEDQIKALNEGIMLTDGKAQGKAKKIP